MWSARFDSLLAGAAMVLAVYVVMPPTVALAQSERQVETGVPTPDLTPLPPPTAKDIAPAAQPPQAGAVNDGVPLPDLTPLPPLTAKDIGPTLLPEQPQQAAVPAPSAPPAATTEGPAPVEATEAPTPAQTAAAPAAPAIDAAVAEKLHGLADGKFDRIVGGKKERASVEAFYQARDFAPLWITDGAVNERGKAAIKYLAGVAADGLDPSDYPTPDFTAAAGPDALAEAELRFTATVLTYAHHAQSGRVHFTRVAADIQYNLERSEPAEVLNKLATATDVGQALDSFEPQQPAYKALKAALAKLRAGPATVRQALVHVPEGQTLRAGMRDERVVSLRKRLDIAGDKDNPLYDDAVTRAVKQFQKDHELSGNGTLTRGAVAAMNRQHRPSAIHAADTVIANMERWRWMPRHLGNPYVMVNIPDYSLRVVNDGKVVWHTKIVVGKPGKRTPLISAEMKYITVNPTWNVPPSIIRNEYLPALREDPNALDRIGLKVERNRDGSLHVFQPPGDRNALGRIRFNFPNKFLVYQHDTPDKYLFARATRAYSHGCMRVEDPLKYAEVLLSLIEPGKGYTEARLHKMFGASEINLNFPKFIPVHLTYQTAFVDDAGKLVLRDDIYGYDASIHAILHGDQRRIAAIPIERHDASSSAPVMMPSDVAVGGSAGSAVSGYRAAEPSFFERLFGIAPAQEPAPPRPLRQQRHTAHGTARNSDD